MKSCANKSKAVIMSETMVDLQNFDPRMVTVQIDSEPVKATGAQLTDPQEIAAIAEQTRMSLTPVDYYAAHGTCMDERPRLGLLSGERLVEPRSKAPGGPDIYGLAIAELTGQFDKDSSLVAEGRLRQVSKLLRDANLKSGGHVKCAADHQFGVWMPFITDKAEDMRAYGRKKLGTDYTPAAMEEVIDKALSVKKSGRYANWEEQILFDALGSEAGQAIEVLEDVPHKGKVMTYNRVKGTTTRQNMLNNTSFDLDVPYMEIIEAVITTGPEAEWKAKVAEHARYAVVRALEHALPNPELHEVTLQK